MTFVGSDRWIILKDIIVQYDWSEGRKWIRFLKKINIRLVEDGSDSGGHFIQLPCWNRATKSQLSSRVYRWLLYVTNLEKGISIFVCTAIYFLSVCKTTWVFNNIIYWWTPYTVWWLVPREKSFHNSLIIEIKLQVKCPCFKTQICSWKVNGNVPDHFSPLAISTKTRSVCVLNVHWVKACCRQGFDHTDLICAVEQGILGFVFSFLWSTEHNTPTKQYSWKHKYRSQTFFSFCR